MRINWMQKETIEKFHDFNVAAAYRNAGFFHFGEN